MARQRRQGRTRRRSRQRRRAGLVKQGYERYANLHGNSGVRSYRILLNDNVIYGITVQFLGGAEYTYTNQDVGSDTVNTMIGYARAGFYLQRFINKTFRGY